MNLDPFLSFSLLLAFLAWFYGPWQETCTDFARQVIFEQRDRLFDLADARKISFDSVEYKKFRSSLNAAIRFSHEMTLARMLFLAVCYHFGLIERVPPEFSRYVAQLPNDVMTEILQIRQKAFLAMVVSMLCRSLVVILVVAIMLPIVPLALCLYFWWVGFFVTVRQFALSIGQRVGELIQSETHYEEFPSSI